MRIRQRAYLSVASEDLGPEAIAALIGVAGDRSDQRGSRSTDPPRPVASRWCLDATANRPVDEQIDELLERVEPLADRLRQVLGRDDVGGSIVVVRELGHADGEEEVGVAEGGIGGQHQLLGFALDVTVLARLADLGLHLDVDEYG